MNKENLKRIIELLKTTPQEQFDMTYYRHESGKRFGMSSKIPNPKCDSIGCIIGHSTQLDPEGFKKHITYDSNNEFEFVNYGAWGMEFLELETSEKIFQDSKDDELWSYMFSSIWASVDNTVEGAIKRLEYVLENGLPKTWHEEMYENYPLSYV